MNTSVSSLVIHTCFAPLLARNTSCWGMIISASSCEFWRQSLVLISPFFMAMGIRCSDVMMSSLRKLFATWWTRYSVINVINCFLLWVTLRTIFCGGRGVFNVNTFLRVTFVPDRLYRVYPLGVAGGIYERWSQMLASGHSTDMHSHQWL